MNSVTPVILCGGGGTRLWPGPLSRAGYPNQFLVLVGRWAEARLQTLGQDSIAWFDRRYGRN